MTEEMQGEYLGRRARDRIVAGRIGEADEAAAALVFLASDAPPHMSGGTLPVDGGLLNHVTRRESMRVNRLRVGPSVGDSFRGFLARSWWAGPTGSARRRFPG